MNSVLTLVGPQLQTLPESPFQARQAIRSEESETSLQAQPGLRSHLVANLLTVLPDRFMYAPVRVAPDPAAVLEEAGIPLEANVHPALHFYSRSILSSTGTTGSVVKIRLAASSSTATPVNNPPSGAVQRTRPYEIGRIGQR